MEKSKLDTEELMRLMEATPEVFDSLDLAEAVPLGDHLAALLRGRDMTAAQLVERSGLSKSFVYQVLAGDRAPGRDVLLRMAFTLRLDLRETQRLLTVARKGGLYPKVRRDAALICCIGRGYGLFETDEFLEAAGERPLL